MTKEINLSLILFVSSFCTYAQITMEKDKMVIRANVFLHYDTKGLELNKERFSDSIASQKYVLGTGFSNDTIKLSLISKTSDIVGKELPEVEWKTINGNKFKYGEKDRITLLSFWSTMCKPCIDEFIELNEWASAYPDIKIIAITTDSASVVSAFMEKGNFLWSNITLVAEYKGDFDDIFSVFSWPTNVVTDNKRIVRKVIIGKNKELIEFIDRM